MPSRIFTRVFSDEAYKAKSPASHPAIIIAANSKRVVPLKVASEGRVIEFSVKQLETEVQVPFEVELLKSKIPFPKIDQDIPAATAEKDSLDLYRLFDKAVVLAGAAAKIDSDTEGFGYKNMDGNWTNPEPWLYALIFPDPATGAAGITTWKLSITVDRSIGAP